MTTRHVYTSEQLERLSAAHKTLCAMKEIHPASADGRGVAARLLDECSGNESEQQMISRFTH